jgi:hypothetical protein
MASAHLNARKVKSNARKPHPMGVLLSLYVIKNKSIFMVSIAITSNVR